MTNGSLMAFDLPYYAGDPGDSTDQHISPDDPNAGGVPVSPGLDLGIESYDLPGELHAYNVLANSGSSGPGEIDLAGTRPGDHP